MAATGLPGCKQKACASGCRMQDGMLHGVAVLPSQPVT